MEIYYSLRPQSALSRKNITQTLLSGSMPSDSATTTAYLFLIPLTRATCRPAHVISIIWLSQQLYEMCNLLSSSSCSTLHTPVISSLSGPNILLGGVLYSQIDLPSVLISTLSCGVWSPSCFTCLEYAPNRRLGGGGLTAALRTVITESDILRNEWKCVPESVSHRPTLTHHGSLPRLVEDFRLAITSQFSVTASIGNLKILNIYHDRSCILLTKCSPSSKSHQN
jgi:hypothetical protein